MYGRIFLRSDNTPGCQDFYTDGLHRDKYLQEHGKPPAGNPVSGTDITFAYPVRWQVPQPAVLCFPSGHFSAGVPEASGTDQLLHQRRPEENLSGSAVLHPVPQKTGKNGKILYQALPDLRLW